MPITKYDLEERTARFGESVVKFCKTLKKDVVLNPLISQLVRSATSVGANYMEANGASSKKDFINKIFICKKEEQETKHWFRMIVSYLPEKRQEIVVLWVEANELSKIFGRVAYTARLSLNN